MGAYRKSHVSLTYSAAPTVVWIRRCARTSGGRVGAPLWMWWLDEALTYEGSGTRPASVLDIVTTRPRPTILVPGDPCYIDPWWSHNMHPFCAWRLAVHGEQSTLCYTREAVFCVTMNKVLQRTIPLTRTKPHLQSALWCCDHRVVNEDKKPFHAQRAVARLGSPIIPVYPTGVAMLFPAAQCTRLDLKRTCSFSCVES